MFPGESRITHPVIFDRRGRMESKKVRHAGRLLPNPFNVTHMKIYLRKTLTSRFAIEYGYRLFGTLFKA